MVVTLMEAALVTLKEIRDQPWLKEVRDLKQLANGAALDLIIRRLRVFEEGHCLTAVDNPPCLALHELDWVLTQIADGAGIRLIDESWGHQVPRAKTAQHGVSMEEFERARKAVLEEQRVCARCGFEAKTADELVEHIQKQHPAAKSLAACADELWNIRHDLLPWGSLRTFEEFRDALAQPQSASLIDHLTSTVEELCKCIDGAK